MNEVTSVEGLQFHAGRQSVDMGKQPQVGVTGISAAQLLA